MKLSEPSHHRAGQRLPSSHTSAIVEGITRAKEESRDDDFWSSFCEDSESGCASQQWKGKQSVHCLEELGDYAEDHFIVEDSIHLDDSYELPSYGNIIYSNKNRRHLSPNYGSTASSGSYKAANASRASTSPSFHLNQYVAGDSFGPEEYEKSVSEDLSAMYYNVENQMPSFHKNRKRAIDEMYDIDNEDLNSVKFPVTPRSFSDVDGRANAKKHFTKNSSNRYSSNTEPQENSRAMKTSNLTPGHMQNASKCASNFTIPRNVRSEVAPLQPTRRQLPSPSPIQEQPQPPALYGHGQGAKSAALATRRVPCMSSVPATCSSFFTAGAVDL